MSESLVFPIEFDLEGGLQEALKKSDNVIKELENKFGQKFDLKVNISDTDAITHIDALSKKLKELLDVIEKLSNVDLTNIGQAFSGGAADTTTLKDNIDKIVGGLVKAGQATKDQLNDFKQAADLAERIATAREKASDEAIKEREAAKAQAQAQRESEKAAKERLRQQKDLVKTWSNAFDAISAAYSKIAQGIQREQEARQREQEAFQRLLDMLNAEENTINNIGNKLKYYSAQIRDMEIGSGQFTETALVIRELTEKLDRANQSLRDFQQQAFKGLGADLTKQQVAELQRLRRELENIDATYNNLRSQGQIYDSKGAFTPAATTILEQRKQLTQQINSIIQTGAKAQLEYERKITAEIKKREATYNKRQDRQADLKAQENSLDRINRKLRIQQEILNKAKFGSVQYKNAVTEVNRLSLELKKAQMNVDILTGKFRKQSTYIERLIKRMALYFSVHQVANFLTQIREVTAQFELQRKSLGALLQDQDKANALFAQIKSFAVQSPIKLLDLTTYVKQVAAYRIEYEKLFDTTKRLADVSVGLGVDMQRIVLAYGQVKAASYLRASEIRQFTEAGIPLLELLAEKFSQLQGRIVSTADVMKMVEKRMVDFSMVEQIFRDMTDAGGMFFQMQEQQADTLYGMWSKLGDAVSIMYDRLGNMKGVNWAMKTLISLLEFLVKNFDYIIKYTSLASLGFLMYNRYVKLTTASQSGMTKALISTAKAQTRLNIALKSGNKWAIRAAQINLAAAQSFEVAAKSTRFWTSALAVLRGSFLKLWAVISANPLGMLAAAIGVVVGLFWDTRQSLDDVLKDLVNETNDKLSQSAANFTALANAVVDAADGSIEQKKALEELKRTYGDMLPTTALTIENLRSMNKEYSELIGLIQQYTIESQKRKAAEAVTNDFSDRITNAQKKFKRALEKAGYTAAQAYNIIFAMTEKIMSGGGYSNEERNRVLGLGAYDQVGGNIASAFENLKKVLQEQKAEMDAVNGAYDQALNALSKLPQALQKYRKAFDENNKYYTDFYGQQRGLENYIFAMGNTIKQGFEQAGQAFDDSWFIFDKDVTTKLSNGKYVTQAEINFDEIKKALGNTAPQLRKMIENIEREYYRIVPSNDIARIFKDRFWSMADAAGVSMDRVRMHIWNGEGEIKDYAKSIKDEIENIKQDIKAAQAMQEYAPGWLLSTGETVEQAQKRLDLMEKYLEFVKEFYNETDKNNRGNDQRMSQLKEIEQSLAAIYQKYKQLKQVQGQLFADTNIVKLYANQLKYLNTIAAKFGLGEFKMPTTLDQLNTYRQQIKQMIEQLRLTGYEKEALQIEMTIGTSNVDDMIERVQKGLESVAQELKRARTAEKFYQEILSTTGDYALAETIANSIFDLSGFDAQTLLKEQIKALLSRAGLGEEDLATIFKGNQIDFGELIIISDKNKENLGENYAQLIDIATNGQAQLAQIYQTYLKDLEKAKSYSQQLVELSRYTARQINAINNDVNLSDAQKEQFIQGYQQRQRNQQSAIEWEAFKQMPMYVMLFSNLNNASTTMLKNMRDRLNDLKNVWGEALDPTALKDIQKQVESLNDELASRNPFTALRDAWRDYRNLRKQGSQVDAEESLISANQRHAQALDELTRALEEEAKAQAEYDAEVANSGASSSNSKVLLEDLKQRQAITNEAQKNVTKTEKEVQNAQELLDTWKRIKQLLGNAAEGITQWGEVVSQFANSVASVVETLGVSKEDVQYFRDIADGVDLITKSGSDLVKAFKEGNLKDALQATIMAIPNIVSGFTKIFNAGKIRAANKEIKNQEQILKQLEYTYNRLQKAADKLFGADYISNYNRQMAILQAQQQAYLKQAEAERSKGKAKDQDKIDAYLEKAREVGDEIADMYDQLAQKFTDTSITDLAREFATSWLEAKASFASTTDAIKEKYRDLIQNLIIEGAAAKVIENALQPMWDRLNELLKGGDVTGAMTWLSQSMNDFVNQANDGMNVLWNSLEQAGINVRKAFNGDSTTTGISRQIATASEESINGLAQGINTQNYYISFVPEIAQNVAALRMALQGGNAESTSAAGWSDWQMQAMSHFAEIQRNTAETALRCEKAASACQEVADRLRRVVDTKGAKSAIRTTLV